MLMHAHKTQQNKIAMCQGHSAATVGIYWYFFEDEEQETSRERRRPRRRRYWDRDVLRRREMCCHLLITVFVSIFTLV